MKLTLEQLKDIERNSIARIPNIKPIKFWSLDDLAKGKMFSTSFLKKIIKNAQLRKQQHRYAGWRGWTKNKRMRSEVRIPTHLYLQPDFQNKYFPEGADEYEKSKALDQLKRDYPVFITHD